MSVVKIIELVGESPLGWEDAMKQVIAEAQKTLRGITRIGVVEQDVRMTNDKIDVWRVHAQVSFRIEKRESHSLDHRKGRRSWECTRICFRRILEILEVV